MNFSVQGSDFYKDGEKIKIISGAVHYFRNMPDTWDDIFLKMKAMGCNCVETYCAWNMHEKVRGVYDFSGRLDLPLFLEKATAHGLMILVRPGPYICAEWEFGGLPWWLQTEPDMEIRCSNKAYMQAFGSYMKVLLSKVRPYLTTNGGNVIMLQVENEYGYYGDDKAYMQSLVALYHENGIDVPLFTSDGSSKGDLLDGKVDGCFSTLNFGSRVKENFAAHDELFPDEPKMCMEMWNGWFDHWGEELHHTTDGKVYAQVVEDMLQKGSVNMYMFIGGTSFGFTAGANHDKEYTPDVTSYDYDALLTECGDVTEKYRLVREVVQKHTKKELPPIPENRPKKAYGKVMAESFAPLFDNLKALSVPVYSDVPKCMEAYGIGYGYILYETTLNRDYDNVRLSFERVGDRAQIFINHSPVGTVFVNDEDLAIWFSAKAGDTMRILCENLGRTNFGSKMMLQKGIVGRCLIDGKVHFGWNVYPLPMDNLHKLSLAEETANAPVFLKFRFALNEKPMDTFLRTDNFRKGFAVLNGFNLGRYWEIGPQKTLYVPASLLKQGENELVLFESEGCMAEPWVEFVAESDLGCVQVTE